MAGNEAMMQAANAQAHVGLRTNVEDPAARESIPLMLDWPRDLLGELAQAKVGDLYAFEVYHLGNSMKDGNLVVRLRPVRIAGRDRAVATIAREGEPALLKPSAG